jgi:uncharacterized protein YndB with AHSA1/START domain
MSTISVELTIAAPTPRVWGVVGDLDAIASYHPWVDRAEATTSLRKGVGAGRRVFMRDGKNWLEERISDWQERGGHVVDVIATSYPLKSSRVTTRLHDIGGDNTRVKIDVEYVVKYALLGQLLDRLFVRRAFRRIFKDSLDGLKFDIEGAA